MVIDSFFSLIVDHWSIILFLTPIIWAGYNKYGHGINAYPGPRVAALTDWYRFFMVLSGKAEYKHLALHRQYGPIVRIGPKTLIFADPDAVSTIYSRTRKFPKTHFYRVQQQLAHGDRVQSLFNTLDNDFHARLRRMTNSAYTMTTLVGYEPLVDSTTTVFLEATRKLYCEDSERECEFSEWLRFYAFDVIGELTFSRRFGFIEQGIDVGGISKSLASFLDYAAPIGSQPWLDYLFFHNPIKEYLMRRGLWGSGSAPIAAFAIKYAQEHDSSKAHDTRSGEKQNTETLDFLTRFRQMQTIDPSFMTDFRVLTMATSLINAGADTTGASLSAVFYYLLRNPSTLRKLIAELANSPFTPAGLLPWAAAQKLSYLDAVIQEAFRLFPAVALPLERHVPSGGATIAGRYVPAGCIVGCNAFVLHRDTTVFGEDVEMYRPERWLDADPAQLARMKGAMLHFGAGPRTCAGRNISTLEMYKLVPAMLWNFEITMTRPNEEWKTHNAWFVRPSEFKVKFTPWEGGKFKV